MSLAADVQKSAPGAKIELYTLDLTPIAPGLPQNERVYHFCAEKNDAGNAVVWQGVTYTPYPLEAEGFEVSGRGTMPRPTLRAANLGGVLSALCLQYQDLVGAGLTRRRTFVQYLDAVNFVDGNAQADPNQEFPAEVFSINRKTTENKVMIEWELRWSFDLEGVMLPRRQIIQNTCLWGYKSAECGWVPSAGHYFDANDQPCAAGSDVCGKRLASCKARFGAKAVLPYGGFPAAGLVRS